MMDIRRFLEGLGEENWRPGAERSIEKHEGNVPYLYTLPDPKSGITVGRGVDLGQFTLDELRMLLGSQDPRTAEILRKVGPAIGVTGESRLEDPVERLRHMSTVPSIHFRGMEEIMKDGQGTGKYRGLSDEELKFLNSGMMEYQIGEGSKFQNQFDDAFLDSLSPELSSRMAAEWYRGSLSGSPNTSNLIRQGKFQDAAKEWLLNKEYTDRKGRIGTPDQGTIDPGIVNRFEEFRDLLEAEANRSRKNNTKSYFDFLKNYFSNP